MAHKFDMAAFGSAIGQKERRADPKNRMTSGARSAPKKGRGGPRPAM